MDELKFYLSRFLRRLHWFLAVATVLTAISVTVAFTLPPAYVSEVRLLVESQQIPDQLAQSTATTPAAELLQIVEQRLMTRDNLLTIARQQRVFPDLNRMSPDEIVQAMRAHTRIRSRSGRDQATVMTITFEAYQAAKAAGVLNAYLNLVLEEEARFRTGRATTTLEFFEQQVTRLAEDLDEKNRQVLEFKNDNSDALPETLDFQVSERAALQDRIARISSDIATLQNQREQIQLIYEATGSIRNPSAPRSAREQRLLQLQAELDEALAVYSEQSPRVRNLRARIAQAEAAVERELQASSGTVSGDEAEQTPADASLRIQLSDIDAQIATLEKQKTQIDAQIEELNEAISRTPANGVALEGLVRDRDNLQRQYDEAVASLARASTGERIEVLSRGQRITVVEPPAVPTEPTKPDRMKLAIAGTVLGIAAGIGLVFLLEVLNRTPRRPEDIVSRFEVMPIASIPFVRTRRQLIVERGLKLSLILVILVGVPGVIYAIHIYYLPLDLIADKVMNRIGVRL